MILIYNRLCLNLKHFLLKKKKKKHIKIKFTVYLWRNVDHLSSSCRTAQLRCCYVDLTKTLVLLPLEMSFLNFSFFVTRIVCVTNFMRTSINTITYCTRLYHFDNSFLIDSDITLQMYIISYLYMMSDREFS